MQGPNTRFTVLSIFSVLIFIAQAAFGQIVPPKLDSSIMRLSDLKEQSVSDNKVTPASFLRANKNDNTPVGAKPRQDGVPAILSGKTKKESSANKQNAIDPLNIPSAPIETAKNQVPPKTSGFNPSSAPSTFVPPANSQSSKSTANQTPGSVPPTNTGSGFNPRGQAAPTVEPRVAERTPIPRVNPNPPINSTANTPPAFVNNPSVNSAAATNNRIPANTVANSAAAKSFVRQQLSPQLKVVTTGPKSVSVNKAAKFEIKLANVGTIDANEVLVAVEIPEWVDVIGNPVANNGVAEVKTFESAKGIIWSITFLPTARESVVSLSLMPKVNRAFNLKTEWTTAPVSDEARVLVTQPNLLTSIVGPAEVLYGQKAMYRITIENAGNGPAEKIVVGLSDNLGGASSNVGTIAAGATKQFEVELTAGNAGALKLEALVSGDAGVESEIAKEIVVRRANLAVAASGPRFKYAGSALTYNLTIENKGDAVARDVTAASLLPVGAEYISGLSQLTQNDGRKIAWKIGDIPVGSKKNFIVTCLIKQAGEARMEFGARSASGLNAGGIVKTTVEALADLTLEVVDPRGPQAVGRDVIYELHVKNRGTKAATNVLVSGEFSDNIDPVAGKGGVAEINKGIIRFAPIRQIDVGESVLLKVVASASGPGTHTFRAIVECKAQDIRRVSEGTTKFFGDSIVPKRAAPRTTTGSNTTPPQINPQTSTGGLGNSGTNAVANPTATPPSTAPATNAGPATASSAGGGFRPPSNPPSNPPATLPPTGGGFQPSGMMP